MPKNKPKRDPTKRKLRPLDVRAKGPDNVFELREDQLPREVQDKLEERKRRRGRPPTWTNPDEMYAAGLAYVDHCENIEEVLTIGDLALWLDLSFEGLNEYEQKPLFSGTVKKLKTRILSQCERRFYQANPVGAIWHSKQLGFKDRSEVENKGGTSNVTEIRLPLKVSE